MLSKIRASDASFRRRMWKRIGAEKSFLDRMNEEEMKKIYLELIELQHECDKACLNFDPWQFGRDELKITLLSEQTKVTDLIFMKYNVQRPVFEQLLEDSKLEEDKQV